jgi:hypothetical protein
MKSNFWNIFPWICKSGKEGAEVNELWECILVGNKLLDIFRLAPDATLLATLRLVLKVRPFAFETIFF